MGAILSPCGRYRYTLDRTWIGGTGTVNFIGLNPSTADATLDDPTIRRCVNFAKAWGFQSMRMLNLFAFRATEPPVMMAAADPIGPENDEYLRLHINSCGTNVAAWGVGGWYRGRGPFIADIYRGSFKVLGLTQAGHPKHPLYLPKSVQPVVWE